MSEILKQAEAFVLETRDIARKRIRESQAVFKQATEGTKRKPPPEFVPSSFLVIRSHAGDSGVRPLPASLPFWISPAIRVLAAGGGSAGDITPGGAYEIECEINNRGDLAVPSAKAEFFLTDPTIGFDTRWATPLGIASAYVAGLGTARLRIPFTPTPEQAGHKCLIVRTYSMMPQDVPIDDTNLSPVLDRHVGQLNIHIASAGVPYVFNLVTQPNFQGTLSIRAATLRDLVGLGLPILGESEFIAGNRFATAIGNAGLKQISGETGLGIKGGKGEVLLTSKGKGPTVTDQKRLKAKIDSAFKAIAAGKARPRDFRELFAERRDQQKFVTMSQLAFEMPKAGLKPGMITAAHMSLTSSLGEDIGGVTILAQGGFR